MSTDVPEIVVHSTKVSPLIVVVVASVVELNDGLDDETVTTEPLESVVVLSVIVIVMPELSVVVLVHSLTVTPSTVVHHSVIVSELPLLVVMVSVHAVTSVEKPLLSVIVIV